MRDPYDIDYNDVEESQYYTAPAKDQKLRIVGVDEKTRDQSKPCKLITFECQSGINKGKKAKQHYYFHKEAKYKPRLLFIAAGFYRFDESDNKRHVVPGTRPEHTINKDIIADVVIENGYTGVENERPIQ